MIGLWLGGVLALAAEPDALKACAETPRPGDVPWAIARTVRIEHGSAVGTGVLVSPDGFLLTAAHVVAGARQVSAVFDDGRNLAGVVVRSDPAADLALVRIAGRDFPCLPVRTEPPGIGGDVFVVGSPGGAALSHTVSKGIVSGMRDVEGRAVVQTDATINPGNSGGPMVSSSGELLGIVSFKLVGLGLEGLGFAASAAGAPGVLGFRWSEHTDERLFQDEVTGAGRPVALPTIERPGGQQTGGASTYSVRERPRWVAVAIGALIVAGGAAATGKTWMDYQETPEMTTRDWRQMKSLNTLGWTAMLGGGSIVALGFAFPEHRMVTDPPERSE